MDYAWRLEVLREQLEKINEGEVEPNAFTLNEWFDLFRAFSEGVKSTNAKPSTDWLRRQLADVRPTNAD